ncbi:MAG: murein biosynthesis integral membrane protein MurJ [Phycisphaerae bacterium]|nr:murein biosynthesis integral membrane protein MurJ [Phycisphaerae bacterium]
MISILTLASRILGLLRDAICSRVFGPVVLHYFYVPFQIPNLARRIFGEGALTAALIPVYTEQLHKDSKAAKDLSRCVITLLVITLAALTLLGYGVLGLLWQFSNHTANNALMINLCFIMLPYVILICSVAALGGLLNVHRHFFAPAAAPIVLNICIISAALFFRKYFGDDKYQQVFALAWAVILAGFLQLLIQLPALKAHNISIKPKLDLNQPGLKTIFKLMAPMIIGLAAVQLNTLFDNLIALWLSATETNQTFTLLGYTIKYPVHEGSVAFLYNAQRCYQFPLGVFGIAIATAVFPILSKHATTKDYKSFADTLSDGIGLVFFIGLPATAGMIIVRNQMVKLIFEGNEFLPIHTAATADTLLFYAMGIAIFCLQQLIVRAFYSFQDSVTPAKIAVRMVVLNFFMNLILIWPLGTGGLALSTSICAAIQVVVLTRILLKRYDLHISTTLKLSLTKTIIATIAMTIICIIVLKILPTDSSLVQLLAAVTVCLTSFITAAKILKMPELKILIHKAK